MRYPLFAVVVTLLLVPSAALAHGVGLEAKLKGATVHVEAFFDDDTPAADANVTVSDGVGNVVAEGKTDVKGTWSFPTPPTGKYKVAVDAGGGHFAKTTITISSHSSTISNLPDGNEAAPVTMVVPDQIVSDGPTRAETTGTRRWLMTGIGFAVIGLLTMVFWRVNRHRHHGQLTQKDTP